MTMPFGTSELQQASSIVLQANTPGYIARQLRPLYLVQTLARDQSPESLLEEFFRVRDREKDNEDCLVKLYLLMAALWIQQTPKAVGALRSCGPDSLHWVGLVKAYMLERSVPSSTFTRPHPTAASASGITSSRLPLARLGGVHA